MSYCINPYCLQPNDAGNLNQRICRNCGSDLLLQGHYQVMRILSDSSGFGTVYDAFDGATPKILKVLKPQHQGNDRAIALFQQEALVLSQLRHPGIPKVEKDGYFQFFPRNRSEPLHCLIMEKIEGLNLAQWMQQQGNHPISQQQALNWLKQLAEILHLVHQHNYFHRDIKPQNIMLRPTGQLVLIDFGAAREMTYTYLAQVGSSSGITKISSVGYTPPEQEKGHAVPQSDFYALGRTFVYLLTGKHLTSQDLYNPLTDEITWEQYAPQISTNLTHFINQLIKNRAADRPASTEVILAQIAMITAQDYGGSPLAILPEINANAATVAEPDLNTQLDSRSTLVQETIAKSQVKSGIKISKSVVISSAIALTLILGGYAIWQLIPREKIENINTWNQSQIKLLKGHSSYVNHILITPDGKKVISASADKTIKIWDLATGKLLNTLTGHQSYVNDLAITPDGEKLISASADKTIKIWNLNHKQLITTLIGHQGFINALVITADGKTLISSDDKVIKLWDLATAKEIKTLEGHDSFINTLNLSKDGKILASGSADYSIKLWKFNTGKELKTLKGHTSFINHLIFTPDDQYLISASADKTIKIWDWQTGQLVKTLTGHNNYVNYLMISPDGQTLVSASADQTLKFWNLNTGKVIYTLTGYPHYIDYFAITTNWQWLVTGSGDQVIRVFPISRLKF